MQEPVTAGFPLSPQQKQLWSWQDDGQVATVQVALLLEGTLNVPRLKSALQKIVERHEILRTSFQRSPGMKFPFQVVNASARISWEEVAIRPWDEFTERGRIKELFTRNSRVVIANTPILYACLARGGEDRHVLIV